MELVKQETKNGCGQAAVAMILGISFQEACELFGHAHGTQTKEVAKATKAHGWHCPSKLQRVSKKRAIPSFCIAKMKWDRNYSWHWVVVTGDIVWDPCYGKSSLKRYTKTGTTSFKGKITSFLPVRPPK